MRTATVSPSSPSGSPKTMMPAGIAEALPAIEVTAITGTAGPIWSDLAEAKNDGHGARDRQQQVGWA